MLVYPAYTTTEEYGVSNTDVAGVYLGFKPHLKLSSVSNDSVKGIKGTSLYKNSFTTTESTRIIKNLDLTGCYLVPAEEGTFYDGEGTTSSASIASNHKLTPQDNKIILFEFEIPGGNDYEGLEFSSKIEVPNSGLSLEIGFTDFGNSSYEDEWFVNLSFSLNNINPRKSFISDEAYNKISMKNKMYEKVRRENIILKSKGFAVKTGGF